MYEIRWPCGCRVRNGNRYWCLRHVAGHSTLTVADWLSIFDVWMEGALVDGKRVQYMGGGGLTEPSKLRVERVTRE